VTKKAKNSSKVPSLSATSTADKGNAGKPQRKSQRKPPIVSQAKPRNDSNSDTPVSSDPISDESSAGKHHQRKPWKVSNARKKGKPRWSAKVQEIGNNALSGDLAYNAFSRAINATEPKDASPIAKSLFRHTIQRDIYETEDSDGSNGLLKDAHEDELECDSEVEDDEVVDTVICDESFIEHDDDDDEEDFGSAIDRSILQESWEVDDIVEDENPSAERLHGNDYLEDLHRSGGIHLHQARTISSIIEADIDVERSLFHLFLTKSFFKAVRKWTNRKLSWSHQSRSDSVDSISLDKLFAYVGLELGMSIIKYNSIAQYWSGNVLEGHAAFKDTMSHNTFELIRSLLTLNDPKSYDHNVASLDPLWHSPFVIGTLSKKLC
jgi:hypothetical protein